MVDADGTGLSFLEAGDGPHVVLLHALGRDAEDWRPVVEALSDRFHCLAMDLPGHGRARRDPPYSFAAMAEDLALLVGQLDGPYALVGHSMGASVGWLHAMSRPRRLVGLVAEDTVLPRRGYGIEEPAAAPPEPVAYEWSARTEIIRQLNAPDPRWWPAMAEVDVPCLLLSGREADDELWDAADLLPDATLVEVPVGHWIHEQVPETFLSLVQPFLAELFAARR